MKCVICGGDEHRDSDNMLMRCPEVWDYERVSESPVCLRALFWAAD